MAKVVKANPEGKKAREVLARLKRAGFDVHPRKQARPARLPRLKGLSKADRERQ